MTDPAHLEIEPDQADISGVTTLDWTRAQLIELARRHPIGARDANADYVPLPPWLASEAVAEMTYDLIEFVELIHPDDRAAIVDLYSRTQSAHGERVSTAVRFGPPGQQHLAEVSLINLTERPEVGVILAVLEESEQVIPDDFDDDGARQQRPTDWMILDLAASGVIVEVEGNSLGLLGYHPEEILGRVPAEFMSPEDILSSIKMIRDLRAQPEVTQTGRRRFNRRDGSTIWMEVSYAVRPDPLPGQGEILNVMWDITERIAAEEALRAGQANLRRMADNFRALADEVPAAVFQCRSDGVVTFHNDRWRRLTEERSVERVHDLFVPEAQEQLDQLLDELVGRATGEPAVAELRSHDGATVWRLSIRPIAEDDDQAVFMGSLEDITATALLRDQATLDPLTGVMNRGGIEAAVTSSLGDESTLVVFVDLDRFKTVNDTWGHEAGDAVLIEVARRLRSCVRDRDAVGRWGGDEFVLVRTRTGEGADDHLELHEFVDRLHNALAVPITLPGGGWVPDASIGIARVEPDDDLVSVIRRADHSMYQNKRTQVIRERR